MMNHDEKSSGAHSLHKMMCVPLSDALLLYIP